MGIYLKIVGAFHDSEEAEEIENIVKVFLIKKRISDIVANNKLPLLSENGVDPIFLSSKIIKNTNDVKNDTPTELTKNKETQPSNVRGLT